MSDPSIDNLAVPIPAFRRAADRYLALRVRRDDAITRRQETAIELEKLQQQLEAAPAVSEALRALSDKLFEETTRALERSLTYALQEILGQPISLKVESDFARGGTKMRFWIERDGEQEDIIHGTGGSVANILSVTLRMFALAQLDEKEHRRFIVLDEQDCWLAPELVPRLVKVVHDAAERLGFQTIMISHHNVGSFEQYADRIYRLSPGADGVEVKLIQEQRKSRVEPDEL
jgi:hypothetical protein